MTRISFARHQFPPAIIRHTVWLYLRFTLSYCDVEDLLAERGLDVSYESVRRWVLKFGPLFARELRRCQEPSWNENMKVFSGLAINSENISHDILTIDGLARSAAVRIWPPY